jgi:hypothetical protein
VFYLIALSIKFSISVDSVSIMGMF